MLQHAKGLGRVRIWKLIQQYGSPQKVIEAGLDEKKGFLFNRWELTDWKEDWERVQEAEVQLISYQDPSYPKNLLKISNFPLMLYVKGALIDRDTQNLAIVGTRCATLYGKERCEEIAKELAEQGLTITSGLARGIDTAAHRGALRAKGRTIAVIGSGLGHIYPRENVSLGHEIAEHGALISEFSMKTPPNRFLFPRRNRIVSGLSLGVLLVESPIKGGGMITMRLGKEQKKPLFALPGRVDWPSFEGNHQLLKEGKAKLVENATDLLKNLSLSYSKLISKETYPHLTEEERLFLNRLPQEEKTIEELVLLTQLPIIKLNVLLIRLVLKKAIKEFPGKIYKKINRSYGENTNYC